MSLALVSELRLSPLPTLVHRVDLLCAGFLGIVAAVGRERSHHWFRFGSKAGMPVMTRRKQGLTRRDGGRPVYRQTLGLYSSLVDCRKVVGWVTWKDPGVASGGSPLGCSSKGQELRLLALVGFAALCRAASRRAGARGASAATGILQPASQAAISPSPLPSSSGPGRCPLTAETGVRFP